MKIQITLATTPVFAKSLIEKYPEEYAIAFAGVAITKIKARPPAKAISIAESNGEILGISVAMARPIGRITATAPVLDMIFVKITVMTIIDKMIIFLLCKFIIF